MRLHRLTFQAIGPFPGRHEIDIDQLAASGLFMLEGPTGSGKSTIIDAIVFALYGSVAAEGAVTTRMRSDHADPETPSFVELTFSTDQGLYRVRRSPEYARAKKRGTGTTREPASATLVRLTSPDAEAGEGIASRADEVGAQVQHLVGLTKQQFTQVVVLPQGQFARFLGAGTAERAEVLQKVFGTEIFERVQERLREQARSVQVQRSEARRSLGDQVSRFLEAASPGEEEAASVSAAAEQMDPGALRAAVAVEVARLETERAAAQLRADDAGQRLSIATEELSAEQMLAQAVARRAELVQARDRLAEQADDVTAAEHRVGQAQHAAGVRTALAAADAARQAVEQARAAVPGLVTEVEASSDADLVASLPDPPTTERITELRAARDAARESRAALAESERAEATLAQDLARLAADEQSIPAEQEAIERARADIETEEVQLRGLRQAQEAATGVAAALEETLAEQARAAAARDRYSALEQARADQDRHEATWQAALAAEAESHGAEQQVRAAWVAGQAARLAEVLTDGEACPVCGSAEHPAPARPGIGTVDDDALERARQATASAQAQVVAARTRRDEAAARVAALAQDAPVLQEAEQALTRANDRVTEVRAAAAEGRRLTAEIERRTVALSRATPAAEKRSRQLAALTAGLAERRTTLAAREQEVTAARNGCATVAVRRLALQERADRAERLAAGLAAVLSGTEQERAETGRLAGVLREEGFASASQAREAMLPATEMTALQGLIQRHCAETHRVEQGLGEPEVAALDGTEVPDVAGARAAAEQARALREEAVAELGRTAAAHGAAARIAAAIGDGLDAVAALVERTDPVVRMAALAAGEGGNAAKLTLATFVLVRRFEEVLAAANARLGVMTAGRYEMVRAEERERGSRERKTGLGIDVIDHVTDTPRSPWSLSGGETFQFSLCLALGLADVVSEENGSIKMGTLFVDEGFGSLDAETLETVMRELTALHQRGRRAVGVVSHVTEMKTQIAERVEVRRGPRGSTLEVRA